MEIGYPVLQRFDRVAGNMWRLTEAIDVPSSDSSDPRRSTLELYENGHRLGPGNSDHATIELLGRGCFSFWMETLLFSTSDNSDPNSNGRQYDIVVEGRTVPLHPGFKPLVGSPLGQDPFPRNSNGDPAVAVGPDATEAARMEALHQISMLHRPGLKRLRQVAASTDGAVLEIGAHVGGSTCAIGDAIRGRGRPIVSVEVGIAASTTEINASKNIHADLRTNLGVWGLGSSVQIVDDWLHRGTVRIAKGLRGQDVGLLFIDADGKIGEHMFHLVPFLGDGCIIVLDDYLDTLKGSGVVAWVQNAVTSGVMEQIALEGGGLWFGRLTARADQLPTTPFVHEQGHCWLSSALGSHVARDLIDAPSLRLLEDGRALGPPDAQHDVIRGEGRGAFSLCNDFIYFSTSDNSDPTTNGRRYEAVVGDEVVPLNYWRRYGRSRS